MSDLDRPIFVTGASGHLGNNLVRALLGAGHRVRAMVRPNGDRQHLPRHDRLEIVAGDLLEVESLARGLRGCEEAYHVAAIYALWTREPGQILRTATEGTQNFFEAIARGEGLRRLVYTSSAITIGFTADPNRPLDERTSNDGKGQDEYNQAKIAAERLAMDLARQRGVEIVVVNPSLIVGPHDHKPTPSNRLVLDYIRGSVPATYHGGLSVVHVEDVARGHILAMDHGKAGERYLLGGANQTFDEVLEILEGLTGRPRPKFHVPRVLGMTLGSLYELGARITGRPPLVTRAAMAHLCGNYDHYDSTKAQRELGYAFRPARDSLYDAVKWFLDHPSLVDPSAANRTKPYFTKLPAPEHTTATSG